jgi:hypothetical protein
LHASKAIRSVAWGLAATGIAAPLLRRRLAIPGPTVLGAAALAPIAVSVATPRTRARDVAICSLQMWAYLAAYEMPYDDPERLRARVRVRYPILADRLLGLGRIPTVRLQGSLSRPGEVRPFERALVWCHWAWFAVPHATVAYILWRRPDRLPSAAARMYAVFDLGAIFYWAVPTAPPWWAAAQGQLDLVDPVTQAPAVRRMMREYGELFWGERWSGLYDALGGNPLAAMPSLHLATSLMAARLLAETGALAGTVGWAYATSLGFALVHLGEHYLVDLLAGAALTETVLRLAPATRGAALTLTRVVDRLQLLADG